MSKTTAIVLVLALGFHAVFEGLAFGLMTEIDAAWQLALGREPTETEVTEAVQLIEQLQAVEADAVLLEDAPEELAKLPPAKAAALTKFCLTLLNLNEFVYVD